MQGDTPIDLINVTNMSLEQHEALVLQLRERRLQPVREYEELTLMQAAARREGLEKKWTKALEMFVKDLARADRAMDTLEARARKLRAFKMEIEEL